MRILNTHIRRAAVRGLGAAPIDWRAHLRRPRELVDAPRRVYATRHTFATRCVQAGADWRAVAEITHNPSESDLAGCAFGQ